MKRFYSHHHASIKEGGYTEKFADGWDTCFGKRCESVFYGRRCELKRDHENKWHTAEGTLWEDK